MTYVQDIVQVYSLPVLFMFILTSKGGQHMRVSHVLSAFATGLNPFLITYSICQNYSGRITVNLSPSLA